MRILLIKMSSMGDILHALPVLADIKQAIGDHTVIDWVVEPHYRCLLDNHPHINRVFPLALRQYPSFLAAIRSPEAKQLKQYLNQRNYDLIIDLQGLIKSAWVGRWANSYLVGYDCHSIREPLASWLYKQRFSVSKALHAITRMRHLTAKALNYATPTSEPDYQLHQPADTQPSNLHLICFPFTTWQSKHWPLTHWQELLTIIPDAISVSIAWGTPDEHRQAQSLCKNHKQCHTTPPTDIAGMQQYLKTCQAFIGVDTGFAHLATAMTIPGVMLMGPTDKNRSGPLGSHQIALDTNLPCRPCHKRTCHLPVQAGQLRPLCLANITAARVWQELIQLVPDLSPILP